MATLVITVDDSAAKQLDERAKRQKPSGKPFFHSLTPTERSIHFLRGVSSRSTMALPAFYISLGVRSAEQPECCVEGYPGTVLTHSLRFSSMSTISLAVRKVFDHDPKGGLTGRYFVNKCTNQTLSEVSEYWANRSGRSHKEAYAALKFLRSVFKVCARKEADLLVGDNTSPLGRRIGLLKQHANQEAAHLSLDHYEFSIIDCAHVVGALALIGEIIKSFDDPCHSSTYFDDLDDASYIAAKHLFPTIQFKRLFDGIDMEEHSRYCWSSKMQEGQKMLLEDLPFAMGWFSEIADQ